MPNLFDPITLGSIHAANRILMAPLTRGRSTREHVPTPVMGDYYSQRSGAGLIISEAIGISQHGLGSPYAPGLWSDEQVAAWRPIVERVHDAGGKIVAQLWHMGRLVHEDMGGQQPVSASDTTAPGQSRTYDGPQPQSAARALRIDEVPELLADYANAAKNAVRAGFDGVQLHAANGYLIDQFLRDSSNLRDDDYGGSIPNRIRLLVEVTQALVDAIGPDRVAVRLSPNGDSSGVNDSDPQSLFVAAAAALSELGIAFLEMREPRGASSFRIGDQPPIAPAIRAVFKGPLILNSDYDRAEAEATVAAGGADGIAFGRLFIANPDLPTRFAQDLPLASTSSATVYTRGAEGYSDYPAYEDAVAAG